MCGRAQKATLFIVGTLEKKPGLSAKPEIFSSYQEPEPLLVMGLIV
jgi:hypothetical protein